MRDFTWRVSDCEELVGGMSYTEKWDKAFDARDRDALAALLDDEFVFVRHQSGKEISKEDMLNVDIRWSTSCI